MDKKEIILLLTACVNPNAMQFTQLQDSEERRLQYKQALRFYLENSDLNIVVCENSLTDFSQDFKSFIENGRLEFITYDGNNYDKSLGKGYGEASMIQYVFNNSIFINRGSNILKITGRLILENINTILKRLKNSNTVYSNTELLNGKCVAYSHVFFAPKRFLHDYFLRDIHKLNDASGYYFEHLLYESISDWIRDGNIQMDFKSPLKIIGNSGSSGTPYYQRGLLNHLKAYIKYLLHRHQVYMNHI